MYAALWLKDKVGTVVFAASSMPSSNLRPDALGGCVHTRGVFRTVCTVPGNFLNEGLYTITPIVGRLPVKTIALKEDELSFVGHDTGSMRKEYLGHWIGVVRPKLAWSTSKVRLV